MEKENKFLMVPIFLVVLISMLGVGVAIPIISPLLLSSNSALLGDLAISTKTLILGFFVSIYPISLFFGAPIIGALSDRIGRRKTFLISLTGELFGFFLFGLAVLSGNLLLAGFSRFIQGFTGGNIATAYSAIADVSKKENKTKNFALVGVAFGLGLILGPVIGGYLSDSSIVSWFNYSTPFLFSSFLAFINILFILFFFKETSKTRINRPLSIFTGFRNIRKAWGFKNLRIIFIVSFLAMLGFNFYTQFFQVLLIEKFHFTAKQLGEFFAFAGFCIVFAQGVLVPPIARRFSPEKVLKISLFTLALGLILIALPSKIWLVFIFLPLIPISQALSNPNITTLVSNLTHKDSQGEIMGINQSIQAIAMAVPPIISGLIFSINSYLPSIVSFICVLSAAIIFLFFFKMSKPEFEEE